MNEIDVSRTDLNLLAFFEVVLATRHVGKAAKALDLTPSAVSHGLGRLRQVFHDPLFLRTPKGVVPTARALELAPAIADILARVRSVLSTSSPFDAATSTRRFTIGIPDAAAAVLLPSVLRALEKRAANIDLRIIHQLPQDALASLESRAVDLVVAPLEDIPPRFAWRPVYEEDFVVTARSGHPFLRQPTLARYCSYPHLVVATSTNVRGMVDQALDLKGRTRRIAVAAPNFMLALAALVGTDLVAALPSSLVALHGARFGLKSVPPPVPLPHSELRVIVPVSAGLDVGLRWLVDLLAEVGAPLATGARK